ncbi:MAG: SCO family protein [Paracoccus sp. (in: a-proteobacteria)]|uniref:SCO family protein n=1 Tax=Paracoccus sp. TaxID=267 RepID=UPI0026DF76EA|nr:SCO family protein [Paracoccus sp. (in: a-proteobacteria)]MDO5632544.1 SCO family protein [Paracoccus sp. (in: a-proteobacteria)]
MTTERRIIMLGTAATALLLVSGWLWLSRGPAGDPYAGCRQSVVSGGMDSFGTDFTLTNQDSQRVSYADVFTKPSLLYFGYTFCPDVCPMDSARNAEAADLLAGQGKDVQTVFITVDPKRDTPEALRDFTALFSDDMIGLTGTDQEIADVNRGWRNYYRAQDADGDDYYLVDHMTNTYLVLPGTGTVEFFGRDVTPADMAQRTACFLDAA